jgi:hypothetical protein
VEFHVIPPLLPLFDARRILSFQRAGISTASAEFLLG